MVTTLAGGSVIGVIERLLFRALTSGEGVGEVLGLWCHVFDGLGPAVRLDSSGIIAGPGAGAAKPVKVGIIVSVGII